MRPTKNDLKALRELALVKQQKELAFAKVKHLAEFKEYQELEKMANERLKSIKEVALNNMWESGVYEDVMLEINEQQVKEHTRHVLKVELINE
jgi:hypothetical protein